MCSFIHPLFHLCLPEGSKQECTQVTSDAKVRLDTTKVTSSDSRIRGHLTVKVFVVIAVFVHLLILNYVILYYVLFVNLRKP